ncbi:MAG: hypothetical protein PVJ57_21850 [Phycisphaerae bacterium]|jgi:hypothetical protein
MTRQPNTRPYTGVFILTVLLPLASVGCRVPPDRQPACAGSPERGQVPADEGGRPCQPSPTTTTPDETYVAVRERLRFGDPAEKEQALYDFREGMILELIPDVIDAIGDTTQSPHHGDTGWGFVGHQAAWMLAHVAYKLDGVRIEDRGRSDYTFFDDMYKGGEALRASGRLKQVQDRWRAWWGRQSVTTPVGNGLGVKKNPCTPGR